MINFNGNIIDSEEVLSIKNRGYNYGDALFETIKVLNGKPLFFEDHYFRLMASMRILRMEIPMNFTIEFLEQEIYKTLKSNKLLNNSARVKLNIHRNEGGFYLPKSNDISYIISCQILKEDIYKIKQKAYEVDLFKDYYVTPGLLSTLKTNNKALHVIANIYASENRLHNCLLLNTNKHVIEAINGNVFIIKDNIIKTPPLADGCLKGIMRKQIIEILQSLPDYSFEEVSISPFELQKADELFLTNVIVGVQPISKYRKKYFTNEISKMLIEKLNVKMRLTS
ncbi:aminotransferase class IV [Yeosuana sp. MJ-SS3]|uniref:branched-chain-amino-acid transaminase n=1 Tax=Gilvirhabdus luticola TaxID=3079858 RepID=A0ABU3U7I3_9FLAO|nr:aminotransferase class IV [Yeosuana sp. MJ-SS3]MDU8886373.1 aminotransferase class IV [Yeosuana sp. MJ-SS3]